MMLMYHQNVTKGTNQGNQDSVANKTNEGNLK